jgi:nucleoid-associated protein Lsr2
MRLRRLGALLEFWQARQKGRHMAKRVIHELVDDINGQAADESITFGLDGVQYEIDLTSKNAAKLRDALAPFVAAGSKLGRTGIGAGRGRDGRGRASARSDREVNQAIRDWAKSNNIEVSDRGRIKQEIVDRYNAEVGR